MWKAFLNIGAGMESTLALRNFLHEYDTRLHIWHGRHDFEEGCHWFLQFSEYHLNILAVFTL